MKKTAIATTVALATGFANVAHAVPKDNTWYTGVKLGWSHYYNTVYSGNGYGNSNGPTRPSQLGAGAFLGYQVNPYLGFELGYDWLGRMQHKGSKNNGSFKSQGIQFSTKLTYPINDNLDIYTRLGGMVWSATVVQMNNADSDLDYMKDYDTDISPLAAIGVEYALTKSWSTRLDYQWVRKIGDVSIMGTNPENSFLSVGVSYKFGQDEEAMPVIQPAAVPAPIVETKHFTLKSDILFNFNKAELKPEGQQALDKLYNQLSSMDSKDGSVIIVLGFTDRIGSNLYNQKLSERRAQSVVDYLVSNKGIQIDKVSVHGMGESNPVTGNTCDHIKSRNALIHCLTPDRRVEIHINGIKNIITQPQA